MVGDTAMREQIDNWRAVVNLVEQAQQRLLEAVDDAGIPAQWYAVLHLLLHAEGHRLPMSHLAREVSITSGGFSKLADRMGREGLIDRRGAVDDKRVRYATLTPAGLEAAKASELAYQQALTEHVLGVVPPELLQTVVESLAPLRTVLPTHTSDTEGTEGEVAEVDEAQAAQPRDPSLPDRRNGTSVANGL